MKRLSAYFLAFSIASLSFTLYAQAPGTLVWSSGPDLPSPRAECAALLGPDNAVILLGGVSPSGDIVAPKLPSGAFGWTTAPDIDITRIAPGAVRHSTSGILIFGGKSGNEPTDEVLLYDYYLGDSQDAEKMSVGRHQLAYAVDGLGRAYAVGGLGDDESGEIFSDAERYTPSSDSWADIASFPDARYGAAGVGESNTYIYVVGGATAGGIQSSAYRYSITSNAWTAIPSMPVAVRNCAAVLTQNRLYVTGGVSVTGPVDVVQVYNFSNSTWTIDSPLPAPRYSHGAVIGALGQLLIAGGYDVTSNASASVWQSQRLNVPETAPVFTTSPVTAGSLDKSYFYDVGTVANPVAAYSLITAPTGMTIQAGSGVIHWQPVTGQVGVHVVTVRATNRVGLADQTFNITVVSDTIPPSAPAEVHVISVTANSVELGWSGATDSNGIDHYDVYRKYRCGFRGIKRCYALVQGGITGETTTVTGLPSLTSYSYIIRSFDADGNQSPNSMVVTFTTLSPPVNFRYSGATSLPANFPLQLQLYASANPAAVFSIISGPPGLTIDTNTGVAAWTPTPADVGVHTLEVMAENSGGSTNLSVTITVNPDVPQLSVQYIPGAGGYRDAVAGSPWSAQVLDGSHTPSTFSIVSAPVGMTIDTNTGLLSWLPTPDDAGQALVTVRAVNAASAVDISFEFYVHFTGPVSNIQVVGLNDLEPTAFWDGPSGTGSDMTAGYTVVARVRYRYGRSWRTHTVNYESEGTNTSVVLSGLKVGKTYNLYINAVDEFDNRGLVNSNPVTFASVPGIPSIGWSISNAVGGIYVIAAQEAVIQLKNYNTNYGAVAYSIISAPAGFSLDPVTGKGRWTPGPGDVGTTYVTLRAVNDVGPRDVSIGIRIYFSGPVINAYTTRSGYNGFASWQSPVDNVFPVASYRITRHWQWGSHRYSVEMSTTGTSVNFPLYPTGAVWHKGVSIVPLDASGNYGVSTPLIPYNGALPPDLPESDPVWIERIDIDTNGVPIVEVRGEVGIPVDIEVTEDFTNWDFLETVTLDMDGVIQCPDAEGQNIPRGSYRLMLK